MRYACINCISNILKPTSGASRSTQKHEKVHESLILPNYPEHIDTKRPEELLPWGAVYVTRP